jgi:transcriptional regulator with PAS, ATPase and Fis domain
LSSFVGVSEAVRAVKDLARQFAARQGAVLIQGETGVGKELLAHALHLASPRADGPFVAVNMAGVAQGMLEAELFGAAAGHGAPRPGKFELAHRGTLFLDEVGDMPLAMQARLLRVLQDGEFEPVGVAQTKAVDVRIIAATGQELEAKVREGTFRRDLFFRLNVLPLRLPPLRERPQDIEALCEAILDDLQPPHDAGGAWLLTPQACALLRQQPWPGNVRQLRNVLEHAAARSAGRVLDTEEIAQALQGGGSFAASAQQAAQHGDYSLAQALVETERTAIERALHVAQGSKSQAASLLGISRSQLYVKLRRHRIPV